MHVPTCFCRPNTSLIFSERHRDSFWGELLNNCRLIFADCSFPENRARACWRFPKAAPVKSCPHFPQICHRPGIRTGQKIKIGLRTKFLTNSLRESGQKFKTCACGKNKNCAKSEMRKISKIFDGWSKYANCILNNYKRIWRGREKVFLLVGRRSTEGKWEHNMTLRCNTEDQKMQYRISEYSIQNMRISEYQNMQYRISEYIYMCNTKLQRYSMQHFFVQIMQCM